MLIHYSMTIMPSRLWIIRIYSNPLGAHDPP